MPDSNASGGAAARHGRHRHRKERVLHTRVSDTLAEDIRRIADDLRVPASNLVRNVLEEVFDVVESVSDDVSGLFGEVLQEADAARERLVRTRGQRGWRHRDRAAWEAAQDELARAERARPASEPASPPPPPIEWHIVEAGQARGPFSAAALEDRLRTGRLDRGSLVWCAGMKEWQPAGEVAALAILFGPPPVPEAPTGV
ncbi:MAG: DUF4339 domain-containing protein [Deltaproteobacteria bacterium]|nr:DUF4339 domain-containing protein [Deltaproteobacteria bacterium]MBW2363128.1 DUF4339 domain-containing protein [Deltaproteobacteria bacterium]